VVKYFSYRNKTYINDLCIISSSWKSKDSSCVYATEINLLHSFVKVVSTSDVVRASNITVLAIIFMHSP
jgi:hypothetical protein